MRLLLVEDNERLAQLLATGLRRAGWAPDVVDCLDAAAAAYRSTRYDAIVLDRGLPDGDGLELIRTVRDREEAPPVLVMTARGALPERCEGLNKGADDYVVKPVAMEELVARLNALVRRRTARGGTSVHCGRMEFDPASRAITVDGAPFDPPRRERMILESLLRAAPRPVAKEALEERLDTFERGIGANAVEVYVHRLRKRLDEVGAGAVIETVRGLGYRLSAPPAARQGGTPAA
ncbi:response regulator transcription factor [Roseomonas sp. NAR14]|uniref:Response regulator transcription factor n=1 Tax=Roseomonas acroporae TaxID=2937791 RepID=A0A9X1Y700_9PROT|nr:response regulator transcription factor [Roseomonas acroporae]MCK8783365.1 response regulator transcription factor [Roseomonas acroporae]